MWPFKSKNKPKEPLYSEHGGYPAPYAAPKVVKKEAANINPPPLEARPSQPPPPPPPIESYRIKTMEGRKVRVTGGHMGPTEGGSDTPPMGGSSVRAPRLSALMPSIMQYHLGYDDSGNNSELLAEADRAIIENGGYVRVSGDAPCPKCQCSYRSHPVVQGALWLHRGCDRLVKL